MLRTDKDAVSFVAEFVASGRPVAAICHAPWTLVEADVLRGRRLTSWPSLRTDIRNAGGTWVDQSLVVDGNLISSRNPDDLPDFCGAVSTHRAGVAPVSVPNRCFSGEARDGQPPTDRADQSVSRR